MVPSCPILPRQFLEGLYQDTEELLLERRSDLHERKKNGNQYALVVKPDTVNQISLKVLDSDTSMYRPSRLMKSLQYLTHTNVIRIWREDLIYKKLN